jgi:quinol monooxygenase YgiN
MPSEEFAAIGFITTKPGKENEFYQAAKSMAESTNAVDAGCINYIFLRKADNSREFALFERWKDFASVQAHLARLKTAFASLGDVVEKQVFQQYRVVE